MAFANTEENQIRLLGRNLTIPVPSMVEHVSDDAAYYTYTLKLPEKQLAQDKISTEKFVDALRDEFTILCQCDHDCCGCTIQSAGCECIDNQVLLTVAVKCNI